MTDRRTYLERTYVATPCSAEWEAMRGTARVRYCQHCGLNVHNLSTMTGTEAEALLRKSEGHICTRFYRRPDGTILTRDCRFDWRAKRRLILKSGSALLGAVFTAFGIQVTQLQAFAIGQSCEHAPRIKRSKLASPDDAAFLSGKVCDQRGAGLPGVRITLSNTRTNETSILKTSDEGVFSSTSLAVGTYGLTAELSGFISFRHKKLEVKPGYRLDLAITLHVGSVGGAALFTDDKDATKPV